MDPSACGYPDADNTGVPPGTVLTPMSISTVTTAGLVIDSKVINSCLTIQAPNVTIRNSRITCNNWRAVDGQSSGTLIEDSELIVTGGHGSGVDGVGVTIRRSELRGMENGLAVHGNILAEDNWIHDLAPTSVSGAHSDGAQLFGHVNITLRHNTIIVAGPEPPSNAAITRHVNQFTDSVLIEDNFLGGGTYTIYCPFGGGSFRVLGNRFADGTEQNGLSLSCNNPTVTWAGNFRDSNGVMVGP